LFKLKEKYEINKCDCKEPSDCSNDCVNRILYTECVLNECLKGCKNNRFQKTKWKKTEILDAGKKGSGLFLKENVKKGDFIIEYVGEVLNEEYFEKRLIEYKGLFFL
jgi:SET domain-containing protein